MSSMQNIKTNVASLVSRRGVQGSCFILCCFGFLAMLALKRLCRLVIALFDWMTQYFRNFKRKGTVR